jgi:hypothetical protein
MSTLKYNITIDNNAYQTFEVNINNVSFGMSIRWNVISNSWVYSIHQGDEVLLSGRFLRLDVNLLKGTVGLGSMEVNGTEPITRDNLGDTVKLFLTQEV